MFQTTTLWLSGMWTFAAGWSKTETVENQHIQYGEPTSGSIDTRLKAPVRTTSKLTRVAPPSSVATAALEPTNPWGCANSCVRCLDMRAIGRRPLRKTSFSGLLLNYAWDKPNSRPRKLRSLWRPVCYLQIASSSGESPSTRLALIVGLFRIRMRIG